MEKGVEKPKPVDTIKLLKEDKSFLLAMVDNPTKAYNLYNIRLDRESLDKMEEIAKRIRMQAIEAFSEISKWSLINNCDGCNACDERFIALK